MLRLEYIESVGSYRIYRADDPKRTVGYESDYYKALERTRQGIANS